MAAGKQGFAELSNKLGRWARLFPNAAFRAYHKAAPGLHRMIRDDYLSGQVLNRRTGRLKASIRSIITKNRRKAKMLTGTDVTSNKGFPYGAYWFHNGRDFLNPAIRRDLGRISKLVLNEIMKSYPKGVVPNG